MAGKEIRSDGPLTASVEKLRGELDHWLEVAMTQGGKALNAFGFRNADKPWNPAVDMVETPDNVFVDVSLPGADPGSIEVIIAGNLLTIKGETPDLQIGSDDTAHVKQRNHGKFQGSIPMPTPVDADSVSASSSNGVLTVRLAKTERAKVRQIPVSADSAPTQTPTTHMES